MAYCFVFLSQIRRKSNSNITGIKGRAASCNRSDGLKWTFLLSFSLVTSFIVFYTVPNYVTSSEPAVDTAMIALTYVGMIIDPVLYMLIHPALRATTANVFTCNGGMGKRFRCIRTIYMENDCPAPPSSLVKRHIQIVSNIIGEEEKEVAENTVYFRETAV